MIPARPLLDAVGLNVSAAQAIAEHFSEQGYDTITLRQLTDLLVPERMIADEVTWDDIPVRHVRSVGPASYASIVTRLSSVDLGSAFEREWRGRTATLMHTDWFVPFVLSTWRH